MSSTTTAFAFGHATLTPIVGKPTNESLTILKQQLYANAYAIHSLRGGGHHGHLALVLSATDYLARAGVAFVPPVHPGIGPTHAAGATQHQISETNRQYRVDIDEFDRYCSLKLTLRSQLIAAVPTLYINELKDILFGFANVECATIIAHLDNNHGIITHEDLDNNRTALKAAWNPDDGIDLLWTRVSEAKQFAVRGNDNITDAQVITALLQVFETTGLFELALNTWRTRAEPTWTLEQFKTDFNQANKERLRKLTARQAGYHGANAATAPATVLVSPGNPPPVLACALTTRTNTAIIDGTAYYYCWTHGLGNKQSHTSATCNKPKPGHQTTATIKNMMGGNNTIMGGGPRPRRPNTNIDATPPGM
jgi:hypothetical protein